MKFSIILQKNETSMQKLYAFCLIFFLFSCSKIERKNLIYFEPLPQTIWDTLTLRVRLADVSEKSPITEIGYLYAKNNESLTFDKKILLLQDFSETQQELLTKNVSLTKIIYPEKINPNEDSLAEKESEQVFLQPYYVTPKGTNLFEVNSIELLFNPKINGNLTYVAADSACFQLEYIYKDCLNFCLYNIYLKHGVLVGKSSDLTFTNATHNIEITISDEELMQCIFYSSIPSKKITVKGLLSNTLYYYCFYWIYKNGKIAFSPVRSFRTKP